MTTIQSARDLGTDDREHPEDALTRDPWGRPEINPPNGGRKTGYRRASSFGSPLESDYNLQLWGKRQVARGIARTDHLQIAVTRAENRLVQATDAEDWDAAKTAKQELDELCEKAMQAVGSDAAAEIGTAAHHIYEQIDLGLDPGHIPTLLRADVVAYRTLVAPRFRMVSVERFVVHDALKVAGTLDRAAELLVPMTPTDGRGRPIGKELPAGTVLLGDVKTAQDMTWAGAKFGVQCYVYATGTPYNTKTGVREPWGHAPPSTEWALIIHAPSKKGTAALYWVDLAGAAKAAEEAYTVYEWRNKLGKKLITKAVVVEIEEDFVELAGEAESMDELMGLYYRADAAGRWNDDLKAAFAQKKSELLERAS